MLQVCKFNKFYNELTAALDENGMEYTADECLGRCDLCHSSAYVKKGDEFISAENVEKLLEKLAN